MSTVDMIDLFEGMAAEMRGKMATVQNQSMRFEQKIAALKEQHRKEIAREQQAAHKALVENQATIDQLRAANNKLVEKLEWAKGDRDAEEVTRSRLEAENKRLRAELAGANITLNIARAALK